MRAWCGRRRLGGTVWKRAPCLSAARALTLFRSLRSGHDDAPFATTARSNTRRTPCNGAPSAVDGSVLCRLAAARRAGPDAGDAVRVHRVAVGRGGAEDVAGQGDLPV